MHQSFKGFLLGRHSFNNAIAFVDLKARGHRLMFDTCIHYLTQERISAVLRRSPLSDFDAWISEFPQTDEKKVRTEIQNQFPFLFYSPCWVRHAEDTFELQTGSIGHTQFQLADLSLETWSDFGSAF